MKPSEIKGFYTLNEWQQNNLNAVYQAILDGEIYATVNSVSKSGTSRRISFYRPGINEKDGRPFISRCTNEIAWLTGWVKPGEFKSYGKYMAEYGLKVGGCGMDMIFHTLYTAVGYPEASNWHQKYQTL